MGFPSTFYGLVVVAVAQTQWLRWMVDVTDTTTRLDMLISKNAARPFKFIVFFYHTPED